LSQEIAAKQFKIKKRISIESRFLIEAGFFYYRFLSLDFRFPIVRLSEVETHAKQIANIKHG